MATRDELADFLEDAGIGTVGTHIFKGRLGDTDLFCAAVIETGGLTPEYAFGESGIVIEHPMVQFKFRGATPGDYATPRAKAETAYRAVAAIANQLINGTRYLAATPKQPPFPIETDSKGRIVIGFNCQFDKVLS